MNLGSLSLLGLKRHFHDPITSCLFIIDKIIGLKHHS